jgi:hypothetical protein
MKYTFEDLWNRLPEQHRNAMRNSMQDPVWHPEGNCEVHTKEVFEYAQKHFPENIDLLLVAIFHDLGKPETQTIKARDKSFKGDVLSLDWKDQKISNLYHELKAEKYIDKYFHLYSDISTDIDKFKEICANHLKAHNYVNGTIRKRNKLNNFENLTYYKDLLQFEQCDSQGRTDIEKSNFYIKLYDLDFFNIDWTFVKALDNQLRMKYSILELISKTYFTNYIVKINDIINILEKYTNDESIINRLNMIILQIIFDIKQVVNKI